MPSNVLPIQLTATAPSPSSPSRASSAPNKTGAANDVNARKGESGRAEGGEGPASFSSALKSRMDKQSSAEDSRSNSQDGATSTTDTGAEAAVAAPTTQSVATDTGDTSAALLPFLVMASAMKDTATKTLAADSGQPVLDATDAGAVGPVVMADFTPVVVPVPVVLAPAAINDGGADQGVAGGSQQQQGAADPLLPVADFAMEKPVADAEKLAVEAATAAGRRHGGQDLEAGALQGEEFRAFMDRATAMAPGENSRTTASGPTTLQVNTPLGQTGWREEMGQKLTWMVNSNRQQADLVLTPPQLGRVEVSLILNGDQASAVFTTANPAVREALEDSMQRLREVLATAGVTLGQTQVGAETPNSFSQNGEQGQPGHSSRGNDRFETAIGRPLTVPLPASLSGRGMVDTFA